MKTNNIEEFKALSSQIGEIKGLFTGQQENIKNFQQAIGEMRATSDLFDDIIREIQTDATMEVSQDKKEFSRFLKEVESFSEDLFLDPIEHAKCKRTPPKHSKIEVSHSKFIRKCVRQSLYLVLKL